MAQEENKTEPPTERRKEKAREQGQVAQSEDVPSALGMLVMFGLLYWMAGQTGDRFLALMNELYSNGFYRDLSSAGILALNRRMVEFVMMTLAPYLGAALAVGLIANYIQVGFLFSAETISPKFNKLNPVEGAKRIFSMRGLFELAKNLLKVIAVGATGYIMMLPELERFPTLIYSSPMSAFQYTGYFAFKLGITIAIILVLLAIIDYIYQRYEHEKSLRMSRREVKEERKEMEGDPHIQQRVKERGREMVFREQMEEVPDADVVITNPTHYAVALTYDLDMTAPQIIAKGVDYRAMKIIELAEENDVPVHEDPPLARALYDQVEVEQPIPPEFFSAVAEILATIAREDEEMRERFAGLAG